MKLALFSAFSIFILSGCVGLQPSMIDKNIKEGNFKQVAIEADKEKDLKSKLDESNQLPTLHASNSYLYSKEYKKSLQRLDEAEKIVKFHNEEILLGNSGDLIAQLLLNDSVIDYHATITESIMINTYKAIDYMALGDLKDARVEFNRAIDRQRRAKETYAKLVQKTKKAMLEKEKLEQKKLEKAKKTKKNLKQQDIVLDISKNAKNPQIYKMISSRYPALNTYEVYPNFINPFTNYLAGIFFATQKDYKKSYTLLKETSKMLPHNKIVKQDYKKVKAILRGKRSSFNNVWIIYANGLAPKKEEFKIDIPLFLVTNKVSYTGIALPKMKKQSKATKNITIFEHNRLKTTTKPFSDMDKVVLTEFKYKYDDIVYRAVFGALIKTYMQYEIQKRSGALTGMAAGFIQSALTKADTRTWSSLPKEFQLAKIAMPKDKKLELSVGLEKINIDLKDSKNAIILVKKTTNQAKVSYIVIKL